MEISPSAVKSKKLPTVINGVKDAGDGTSSKKWFLSFVLLSITVCEVVAMKKIHDQVWQRLKQSKYE